jgi:putative lipoic acid-binding regulatory protein
MEADESLLRFPCDFPIKAMGKAEDDFDTLIVELIRKHSPDLREGAVKSRHSNGGRFVSVTVTIQAESREQLDRIYMELTAEERVLMAL